MIFGVRHGERADFLPKKHPERKSIQIPSDPQLSDKGVLQAEETGRFIQKQIDKLFKVSKDPVVQVESSSVHEESKTSSMEQSQESDSDVEVIIVSSPFLRTIMTSFAIARNLRNVYKNTVFLQEDICEFLSLHDYQSQPLDTLFYRSRPVEIEKYIDSSKFKISWNFFQPKTRPRFPENRPKATARIASGMELLKEHYYTQCDFKRQVLVYVTHRFTLQCSAMSFGKNEPAPEDCGYCGVIQVAIEREGDKIKEDILLRGTNKHISHLL